MKFIIKHSPLAMCRVWAVFDASTIHRSNIWPRPIIPGDTDKGGSENSGPLSSIAIHSGTRLAASNWTNSFGIDLRIVYFQDEYSHVVAQHWDSSRFEWSMINIMSSVGISAQAPLPMSGTPLTNLALNYQDATSNYVFYQDEGGSIYQLGTTDSTAEPSTWTYTRSGDSRPTVTYRAYTFQETYPELPLIGFGQDSVPKWTSMATTAGGWFYGMRNGRIIEFQNTQEQKNESTFHLHSIVYSKVTGILS